MFNVMKFLKSFASQMLVVFAIASMVSMPLAMGAQAEKISKQKMLDVIKQSGLNQSQTFAQYYERNKENFPKRVQIIMDGLVKLYGAAPMPQFEVTSAKQSNGEEITVLRATSGNQLINIQLFGEENKFARFGNSDLSEIDIINFDDMLIKLTNQNSNFRKQADIPNKLERSYKLNTTKLIKTKPVFSGYPAVDTKVWQKMNLRDKASYIVNMRKLWSDSIKVLASQKRLKTSFFDFENSSKNYSWNQLLEVLFIKNSWAVGDENNPRIETNDGFSIQVDDSKACVVAGYISEYVNKRCSVAKVKEIYQLSQGKNDLLKNVFSSCKAPNSIPCNPYIYGVNSKSGDGHCVSIESKPGSSFQTATHYNGACEKQSSLGFREIEISSTKGKNRYNDLNVDKLEAELKKEFEQDLSGQVDKVEDFLKGLIKFKTGKEADTAFNDGVEISNDVLDQILDIKKAFDKDISKAREICKSSAQKSSFQESNFYGACDQLHRRFLFVKEFLEQRPGCPGSATVNPETLKCICGNNVEVNPGQNKCSASAETSAEGAVSTSSTATVSSGLDLANYVDEICPDGVTPCKGGKCVNRTPGTNLDTYECVLPGQDPAKKPSFWESGFGKFLKGAWKFTLNAAPYILTAAALYGSYQLFKPKQPKIKGPGDLCPNGTIQAPCPQPCPGGQAQLSSGGCGCTNQCSPLEKRVADTCACVPSGDVTVITCADGETQVTDRDNCPENLNTNPTQPSFTPASKVTAPKVNTGK